MSTTLIEQSSAVRRAAGFALPAMLLVGLLVWAWPPQTLSAVSHLFFAAAFLVLALPAGAMSAYLARLRQIHALAAWAEGSLARRWLSGPWLCLAVGAGVALGGAAMLALRAVRFGSLDLAPLDLALLAAAPLVFLAIWRMTRSRLMNQFQPTYREGRALFCAALLAALAMATADAALRLHVGAYGSAGTPALAGQSALVGFVAEIAGLHADLENRALAAVTSEGAGLLAAALLLAANFAFHLFLALSFAAFALPRREFARILAPPAASPAPPHVTPGRRARAAACLAGALLLALPAIHGAELALRAQNDLRAAPERARIAVERIGDVLVREGTIARLDAERHRATILREEAAAALAPALDAGFDAMRGNVESYLDWYYSLPSEYARLAMLVAGDAEAFLAERMAEALGAGDPFAAFDAALAQTLAADAAITAEFHETAQALLAQSRVAPDEAAEVETLASLGLSEALRLPEPIALTSTAQRLGISVASGGIAGMASAVVAGRAANRLIASGSLRIAARALQAMAGRTVGGLGGAAAGAAAGGAVGSVVPGFGTAIGAVAGGIIGGIGVGLGTDYLILKLEEAFSRDAHRAAILAALDADEATARRSLGLSDR